MPPARRRRLWIVLGLSFLATAWLAIRFEVVLFYMTTELSRSELEAAYRSISGRRTPFAQKNVRGRGRRPRFQSSLFDWAGHTRLEFYYGESEVLFVRFRRTLSGTYVGKTVWLPNGTIRSQYIHKGGGELRLHGPWLWNERNQGQRTKDCRYSLWRNIGGRLLSDDTNNLSGYDFSGAYLQLINFDGAQLQGAIFDHAHLDQVSFIGADATRARFNAATVWQSNFSATTIAGASFRAATLGGSEFSDSVGLTPAQMRTASSWLCCYLPSDPRFDSLREQQWSADSKLDRTPSSASPSERATSR